MSANRCPKCGEPAKVAIVVKAKVRVQITSDGSLGKVLSLSRTGNENAPHSFECGGGHIWPNEEPWPPRL